MEGMFAHGLLVKRLPHRHLCVGGGGCSGAAWSSIWAITLFLNKHATWSRILLYLGWQCKYQQQGGTAAAT